VKLPNPVFPKQPELLSLDDNYEEMLERARQGRRQWNRSLVLRAMEGWLFPYIRSRILPGQFHPIIAAKHDWGTIEDHKFEVSQLSEMKKSCQTHCFSTLNHNLGFCYTDSQIIKWVLQQALHGFQGVTGSFA